MNCDKCSGPIAQLDEYLDCGGDCAKRFHVKCAGLPTGSIKYIQCNKNIAYMCDYCLNNIHPENLNEKYESVLKILEKILETVNNDKAEIMEKIDNLTNKQHTHKNEQNINKTMTLAEIIKTGNSSSVLIKPKKLDQKSDETKTYIKEKINPVDISVNGIRKRGKRRNCCRMYE